MAHMITEKQIEASLNLFKLVHEENQFQRIPLEVEANMLKTVREGDYRNFKVAPYPKLSGNIGIMADNPITAYSYIVVASITAFSRIAIEEGVIPDDAFDLSDTLLYHLSMCKTLEEIHNLYQISGTMFARRIHNMKKKQPSYQLERVLNYISRHIYNKITLEEIADYVHLSVSYLSHMFTSEMNMSIHNYIQREKTVLACNLLMHTDRSISDIATYLGFQTPSNFSSVFRKWQQMSPSEYREKNYKEVY